MASERVAIVTGAAGGIGRALCTLLAEHGWRLTIVGRTPASLEETRDVLTGRSAAFDVTTSLLIVPGDVGDPEVAASVVSRTMDEWGRIDGLVNNAAIAEMRPIEDNDRDLLERMFAANTFGPASLIAAVWPVFEQQGGGRIVNVSSIATTSPFPGLSAYAASKGALESLTRSIMVEGGSLGIRAFSIGFGAVETAMLRSVVTREELPESDATAPAKAAQVIVDCLLGRRDGDAGKVIS